MVLKHPWAHPDREPEKPGRSKKVTMVVTEAEYRILMSAKGTSSMSEFLRRHFPASLFRKIKR